VKLILKFDRNFYHTICSFICQTLRIQSLVIQQRKNQQYIISLISILRLSVTLKATPMKYNRNGKVPVAILVIVFVIIAAVVVVIVSNSNIQNDDSTKYEISIEAGIGGSISPESVNVENGNNSPEFTITPLKGYQISDVKIDDVSIGAISTYTFHNVTTNHTIAVTFSKITYTITTYASTGIESISGSGTYTEGTEITLTAKVKTGNIFSGWYDDSERLVSSDNPMIFRATTNKNYTATASEECTLTLYSKKGITTVDGSGQYGIGSFVTVSATVGENSSFIGWFSENDLLSVNKNYSFEIKNDISLFAYGESNTMINEISSGSFNFTSPADLDTGFSWTIVNNDQNKTVTTFYSYSNLYDPEGGSYTVYLNGTVCGHTYTKSESFIDYGSVSKTFKWSYNGSNYGCIWTINYSTYLSWRNDTTLNRWPTNDAERTAYVINSVTSMESLSNYLAEESSSMTGTQRANFVLKFVQSTNYVLDSNSRGVAEWFKYPIETLFDNGGDCEDTSILYCTLMYNLDYDVALLHYPTSLGYESGHMAAAVSLTTSSGTYYLKNGDKYYYCETTSDNKNVGTPWDEYSTGYILVISH
jgi:hypothetical protein